MENYTELELIMLDIVDFGENEVYNRIEQEQDAIKRFNQRHLFFEALEKIKNNDFDGLDIYND